jgi:Ca2+-binding EF-hand superfamily protein
VLVVVRLSDWLRCFLRFRMSFQLQRQDIGLAAAGVKPRRKRELSTEQRQEIADAFALFDEDKDGFLDYYELKVTPRPLIHLVALKV